MSLTGKSTKSITKKDLFSDKYPIVSFKKIVFAHKATAGDTTIDLLALNMPTEASSKGLTQPNTSDLAAANLQVNLKNLTLMSSSSGTLLPYVSYTISQNKIVLDTPALADELFVGIIDPVAKSDSLVGDTEFICVSGTLTAGITDINVGKSFAVNQNPNQQLGRVMVIIDGQILLRNVGNATASPSADGDYQELPDSTGQKSSVIRLNTTSLLDRAYIVVSTVLSVVRPDGSLVDEIERLQGLVDGMIPTLADLAGVPETDFQVAPTSQQLKQFGDRVLDLEQNLLEDPTDASQGPVLVTQSDPGAVLRAGQLLGTNTNDTAAAGYVGELIEASQTFTSVTANTTTNVISITLTAGSWDVSGCGGIVRSGGGSLTHSWNYLGVSLTSAAQDDATFRMGLDFTVTGDLQQLVTPTRRINVPFGGSTTVYLVLFTNFSGTTANKFGYMRATRVR